MLHIQAYTITELAPYINWIYFFHAWGMPPRFATVTQVHDCPGCRGAWQAQFPESDQAQARESIKLYAEAQQMLRTLSSKNCRINSIVGLFPAWSDGDDVMVAANPDGTTPRRLCFLRQQQVLQKNAPYLCLADFISPHRPPSDADIHVLPIGNVIGLFATAAEASMEHHYDHDDFKRLLVQTLSDRLAEAAAERLHEQVRQTLWGYAPSERFSCQELFSEKYQGRRPAIGYPSMPDQSFIFDFAKILPLERIGITLTENGMMQPHAAVAGLMLGHPATRHFSIGTIDEAQLCDYAKRRSLLPDDVRRYLVGNLKDI